jgi:hypothetical protein
MTDAELEAERLALLAEERDFDQTRRRDSYRCLRCNVAWIMGSTSSV